ncbi:MAG: gliding motility-associated C-terminal domain-containing protein [Bacteroidales bacterium]|nr:gliding motility-associated C-terminal domain-containing protein [Bacteroidales bacterium]
MTQLKIKRIAKYITALIVGLAAMHTAKAENTVRFVTPDTVICDGGKVAVKFYVELNEPANVKLFYTVDGNLNNTDGDAYANIVKANNILTRNINFGLDQGANFTRHTVELIRIETEKLPDGGIKLNQKINIDVYATPQPEILTAEDICGFGAELKANNKWKEISTYHWETDLGELTDADKETAYLSMADDKAVGIRLTETTGGTCYASADKTIILHGYPKATISKTDETGQEVPAIICSNIADNAGFTFDFDIRTEGNAPFAAKFSNGESIDNIGIGTTNQQLRLNHAGQILLTALTDKYGCEAPETNKLGTITVADRKPSPTLPTDTANYEVNKHIKLSTPMTNEQNTFEWRLADESRDYDAWFNFGNSNEAEFDTNINGLIKILCIEKNKYVNVNNRWLTFDQECADTASVMIYVDANIDYPSGISPNGDGKNDRLVISGLPPVNNVIVFDAKGKEIISFKNYRNDWQPDDDIADGYYYYIVKSGSSTVVKQALTIKRSIF